MLLGLASAAFGMMGCASGGAAPDTQAGIPAAQASREEAAPPAAEGVTSEAPGAEALEELPPKPLTPAQRAALRVEKIEIRPAELTLEVGGRASPQIVALEADGAEVEGVQLMRFVQGQAAFFDAATGEIEAVEPGEATMLAGIMKPSPEGGGPDMVFARARINVQPLPVARLEIGDPEGRLYSGTRRRLPFAAFSERVVDGDVTEVFERQQFEIAWISSDPSVASVTANGFVVAGRHGETRLTATSEGVKASVEVRVEPNPVRTLSVEPSLEEVLVGDVTRFSVVALDSSRGAVEGVGAEWTIAGLSGQPVEAAWISQEGSFVASAPGLYRVTATVADLSAVAEVSARERPGRRKVERVGYAATPEHSTSDLWVFQGRDGRDYAYTGTHAAGKGGNVMYAWDVTDPSNPVMTDSVLVDARVVNDVKVNSDASLAVITREGASDRRNGIVVLDLADPAHPVIASSYTTDLTAGIHNTWIEGALIYAINDGTRAMHIIDISDPAAPVEVGRWELEKENKYLHDVMVKDGLAYLSYWNDGLIVLDVGAGIRDGTPTRPTLVSQHKYRSRHGSEEFGNTHHAVRYKNYVFLSDEIMGCEECVNGPRGYVHVVDVTEIETPREVARYHVPEAGAHNMWIEDDKLYVAYYQGGLRVVDVSGELSGDLYRQGREIGWFMTESRDGFRPNDTMAWGPQPYKGNIFVSDMNSGLWVVKLEEPERALVP
jgi:hypothetical protein